ncbi:MAG: heavy metal-responsive transcriptional regulator [Acidobacteria bacterium]|nr:heavy metal-responsive transcriptional regulator [Acidobacteriota bacterium]
MMNETRLLMGEVAKQAGVNRETIRYYERIGLLQRPLRTRVRYRVYSPEAVARVRFIKRAQNLGFSLDEIREIVNLSRAGRSPCSRVRRLLQQKLEDVDRRIAELLEFRHELAAFLEELESVPDQVDSSARVCALIELSSIRGIMKPKTLEKEVISNGS